MDAIAKEAGVSKATVYSYYGDKSSLFADVMVRMCEEVGGHRQVEGLVGASLEDGLRAISLFWLNRMLEALDRQFLQRVVAESREFPELGKKFWETGPGRVEASWMPLLPNRAALAVMSSRPRFSARSSVVVESVPFAPIRRECVSPNTRSVGRPLR